MTLITVLRSGLRYDLNAVSPRSIMPLTILVVDDDLGTRLSIGDYLEMSGYLVISAKDGREALRRVDEYKPHLIVTDIAMPEIDGYELIRQVRTRPAFRLLPVIFFNSSYQCRRTD
jgi:CheY-like chemotaxis protein